VRISTTIATGVLRPSCLTEQSRNFAEPSITDYARVGRKQLEFWRRRTGPASRRPAKAASALVNMRAKSLRHAAHRRWPDRIDCGARESQRSNGSRSNSNRVPLDLAAIRLRGDRDSCGRFVFRIYRQQLNPSVARIVVRSRCRSITYGEAQSSRSVSIRPTCGGLLPSDRIVQK